jgi:hemerythrin superfamily protein
VRRSHAVSISVEEVAIRLATQHQHIVTMMDNVVTREGTDRQAAFAELCRFFAAHEAAERECIHVSAREGLDDDTAFTDDMAVVEQRVREEDEAGTVISELERLGTGSPEFLDKFETFRRAVVAHAEAEEREEIPKLRGKVDEVEVTRMHKALARVPELASRNGENGTSFLEHLQAARAEFRSLAPTAREPRTS